MSDALSVVRTRVDPSPRTAGVAVGDVVAILTFVVIGEYTHGVDPLANLGRVAGVALPFLLGWGTVALAGSLYTDDATASVRRALSWTVPAWITAVVVAQLLRGTALFPGEASLLFALVSTGIGGTAVVGWRVLVTVIGTR
ncbi:MAG: DUF3054 domain-containing protein [Haloarculaceae archaeon]